MTTTVKSLRKSHLEHLSNIIAWSPSITLLIRYLLLFRIDSKKLKKEYPALSFRWLMFLNLGPLKNTRTQSVMDLYTWTTYLVHYLVYFYSKRVLKQIPFVTVRLKFMAISFPQIKVQEQKFLKEVVVSLRLFDIIFNTFSKNIHRLVFTYMSYYLK